MKTLMTLVVLLAMNTSFAAGSGEGFGHYHCIQSSAQPNVVYMITKLYGKIGRAARVTGPKAIADSELVGLSSLVDSVLSNDEGSFSAFDQTNTATVNGYKVEAISMDQNSFPQSFYGYNKNAKYVLGIEKNGEFSIIRRGAQVQYLLNFTPSDFSSDTQGLGAKKLLKGWAPSKDVSPVEISERHCGYWHAS